MPILLGARSMLVDVHNGHVDVQKEFVTLQRFCITLATR